MKYMVTGATGFTGGALTRTLLERGQSVRVLIRKPEQVSYFHEIGVEPVVGDLTDCEKVVKASQGVDGIFHIGAAFRTAGLANQAYWDINVGGTKNVMESALKNGVKRVVHTSTIGVHGHVKEPPATETAPFNAGDIYQETKLEGEITALSYHKDKNVPVAVIRPAGIYGPGDMRFLKLFKAIEKKKFVMLGSGNIFFHPVFITDLVEGFILAMNTDKAIGESFIIAGPRYIPLNELVATIARELNVPPPRLHIPVTPVKCAAFLCEMLCKPFHIEPPLYRRRVDFFTKCRAFDTTKAQTILGYQPKVTLEEGIHKTAQWYKQQGLLN